MTAQDTVGKILDDTERRDAIHIAMLPVIASETLHPGQNVGALDGYASDAHDHVGIVDPFLKSLVRKGDRFWLWLYPNTITSLRHEWTHPVLDAYTEKDHSRDWIKSYADSITTHVDDLMEAAVTYLDYGEYLSQGGKFEGVGLPDEFWTHFEIVTGRKVDEAKKGSFFSCSC